MSNLGGLFALLWQIMEPLPLLMSEVKFKLGVISMLFMAKTFKDKKSDDHHHHHDHKENDFCTRDEQAAKDKGGKLTY